MILARRLVLLLTRPKDVTAAILKIDDTIKELIETLKNRAVPNDKIEELKRKARKCKYARALSTSIAIMKLQLKDDIEVVESVYKALIAIMQYYDLVYTKRLNDVAKAIHWRFPAKLINHRQQKVEESRVLVIFWNKWVRMIENIRFQAIMKQDERLMSKQRQEKKEASVSSCDNTEYSKKQTEKKSSHQFH